MFFKLREVMTLFGTYVKPKAGNLLNAVIAFTCHCRLGQKCHSMFGNINKVQLLPFCVQASHKPFFFFFFGHFRILNKNEIEIQ